MKIGLFIGIVLMLASCSERESDPIKTEPSYPYDTLIDQVKAQAQPRTLRTSLGSVKWNAFPNADPVFISALMRRSVNNNDTLPSDTLSYYHFYDFSELEDLFLFTIVRCDPSGFASMYHFTFDREKRRLNACTLIGSSRKVEGYTTNDKLTFAKDGRSLIVNASSEVVEGNKIIEDRCSTRYDFYRDETTARLLHNAHREKPLTAQGL